jgi:hypothetical protein
MASSAMAGNEFRSSEAVSPGTLCRMLVEEHGKTLGGATVALYEGARESLSFEPPSWVWTKYLGTLPVIPEGSSAKEIIAIIEAETDYSLRLLPSCEAIVLMDKALADESEWYLNKELDFGGRDSLTLREAEFLLVEEYGLSSAVFESVRDRLADKQVQLGSLARCTVRELLIGMLRTVQKELESERGPSGATAIYRHINQFRYAPPRRITETPEEYHERSAPYIRSFQRANAELDADRMLGWSVLFLFDDVPPPLPSTAGTEEPRELPEYQPE